MKIVAFVLPQKKSMIFMNLESIQTQDMQETSFLRQQKYDFMVAYDDSLGANMISARILPTFNICLHCLNDYIAS